MEIRSLIGYFDLDPNRVAALVLDVFQDQWDNLAYLQLLPLFSAQAVSASLAFIYAFYKVHQLLVIFAALHVVACRQHMTSSTAHVTVEHD